MPDRIYCYPDSDVLKNTMEVRDSERLSQLERRLTMLRLLELIDKPVRGKFDLKHLQAIHKYIFQDIYEWAGEIRKVDIKGNMFCNVRFLSGQAAEIFGKLKEEDYLQGLEEEDFIGRLAYYFSEINALHPFREGNGRSQQASKRNTGVMRKMEFVYKRAGLEDIELLVKTRIEALRAANCLSDDTEMPFVELQSREYYEECLQAETHIAYLVFDGERFIGAGGVSFFRVMPTYHNPTGWKAYIMNMYTNPNYRRKGIAYHTLEILIEEAKNKGVKHISLEATDMGRPLYERYGFVDMRGEMELPEDRL